MISERMAELSHDGIPSVSTVIVGEGWGLHCYDDDDSFDDVLNYADHRSNH